MMRGAIGICLCSLPWLVYFLYVQKVCGESTLSIECVIRCGALAPNPSWEVTNICRVFTAPLLHLNYSHLFSNILLSMVAQYGLWMQSKTKQTQLDIFDLSTLIYSGAVIVGFTRMIIGAHKWSLGGSGGVVFALVYVFGSLHGGQPKNFMGFSKAFWVISLLLLCSFHSTDEGIDHFSHLIGGVAGALCVGLSRLIDAPLDHHFLRKSVKIWSSVLMCAYLGSAVIVISGAYLFS